MKPIFILLMALAAAATASAGQLITAVVNNGDWASAATWNLNRVPQNGDTIYIPASKNVNLTTSVTLNGMVIKIWGSLSLSAGAKLNLDTTSIIRVYSGGTITGQSNNDQIKIGNTHIFKGNDPAIVGAVYADLTTGGGFAPMSTLPVTFVNFYVAKENDNIKITWSTANENKNNHFEIERSIDGVNWSTIAVIVGNGNSNSIIKYSYVDKKMNSAVIYYRIKQVDEDGRAMYTATKSVSGDKSASMQVSVNSSNNITVAFNSVQSSVKIKVWTLNGQSLLNQSFNESAYITFKLSTSTRGVYVVQVIDGNQKSESKRIFLN
jgi:hypothetical protein